VIIRIAIEFLSAQTDLGFTISHFKFPCVMASRREGIWKRVLSFQIKLSAASANRFRAGVRDQYGPTLVFGREN